MSNYEYQQEEKDILIIFVIDTIRGFGCLPLPETLEAIKVHNDSLFSIFQTLEPNFTIRRFYQEVEVRVAR